MAFQLKGKIELDATGLYVYETDKTGEFDATTNPTGWGDGGGTSGNPNLGESALVGIGIVNNDPVEFLDVVGQQIKYSPSFSNDTELTFQYDYKNDGYHSMWMFRFYVSADDVVSLDTYNPRTFTIGDVWYNTIEQVAKYYDPQLGIRVLDLSNIDDVGLIVDNPSVFQLLCEDMFYTQLAIEKQNRYLAKRQARYDDNTEQEQELARNINDIQLNIQGADYNFRGGLKLEAHSIIESTLDDYVK